MFRTWSSLWTTLSRIITRGAVTPHCRPHCAICEVSQVSTAVILQRFAPLLVVTAVTEVGSSGNSLGAELPLYRAAVAEAVASIADAAIRKVCHIARAAVLCSLDPLTPVAAKVAIRSARNTLGTELVLEITFISLAHFCLFHGTISEVGNIS